MARRRLSPGAVTRRLPVDVVAQGMGGPVRMDLSGSRSVVVVAMVVAGIYLLASGTVTLWTPDQKGYRLYKRADYVAAAESFASPMWAGIAQFRQGEFEKSAGIFAGYDTAESTYNHGNALLMQGKYEAAAQRYARALELRPEWEDAAINHEIAVARAAMLKQEGGDMTGGMLGADDIVFTEGKSPPGSGEEQTEGGDKLSDAELRAVWLRQVQTKPADFLEAKFAYQYATRPAPDDRQEVAQ